MVVCGLGMFLGGFAVWFFDNRYCLSLRRWRRDLGLPWGLLLEGHGWWYGRLLALLAFFAEQTHRYIMTGTGAYLYIVWGIWLRHTLNGRQEEYELYWPRVVFSLPEVVKSSAKKKL